MTAWLALALLALGCNARDDGSPSDGGDETSGEDTGTAPFPQQVTPMLDPAHAAEAMIGHAGGVVETTDADGTTYRLEIPEGALQFEETIRITPVLDLQGSSQITFGSGVQFEPDGLVLLRPGRLEIERAQLPTLPDGMVEVGYAYDGAGDSMHPDLALHDGATLTFSVPHFSGAGSIVIAPESVQQLVDDLVGQQGWYEASLAALYLGGETQPVAYANVMNEWYDDALAPGLAAADDDETLRAEMGDYVAWAAAHELIPSLLFWSELQSQLYRASGVDDRVAAGLEVVRTALTGAFDRNNEICEVQQSLAHAESAMRWHWIGRELDLWPGSDDEVLQAARDQLCVEMIFTAIDYPQSPTVGQTGLLTATLGPSFDGSSIADGENWATLLEIPDALGTAEPFGASFGGTEHEIAFTPTGERELSLRGAGCLDMPEYLALGEALCVEVAVVRGFSITPTDAQTNPGGTIDFDALLFGEPHPSVAWSATGGTIDSDGTFVADEPGSITITATSQTTAGLQRTATVSVGEGCDNAFPRTFSAFTAAGSGEYQSATPVEASDASGTAGATGNVVYATHTGTDGIAGAAMRWGFELEPVDPADIGAPVTMTSRISVAAAGSTRAHFACGNIPVELDNSEGSPSSGVHEFVVETIINDHQSLYCEMTVEASDDPEGSSIEVTFLDLEVATAVAYDLCMN